MVMEGIGKPLGVEGCRFYCCDEQKKMQDFVGYKLPGDKFCFNCGSKLR